MTVDIQGALADVVPFAREVWAWAQANVLLVMGFTLALVLIVVWGRRRRA